VVVSEAKEGGMEGHINYEIGGLLVRAGASLGSTFEVRCHIEESVRGEE
jgi:hypothetical protein